MANRFGIFALAAGTLFSSFTLPVLADSDLVNVYSARKEALIKPLLDKFEAETNIVVNLVTGNADALLKRLQIEGSASPADVFITVDAGRLQRAKDASVLQPITSKTLDAAIPAHLRDTDRQWYGLSQRARTIFYAKDKVDPAQLSTYEDLADPKWKGKICSRSSNNVYNQSLVAAMLEANGTEQTENWAKGFVKNFAKPPAGGDTDQLRAVNAGVCELTLANTYYFGRLANSSKDADKQLVNNVGVFWANQDDRGTHVNVSGAGVTKASKNKENAIKLIEFLTSPESQKWYAEVNSEYPVVAGSDVSSVLRDFGDFKADTVELSKLGENNRAAVELMDRAGWK
ncbi:Fe(3+) ABC transporter substrate-binding protein [Aliamphritea spongicola]|uniref:Fe(3+) ABC transporter substrate-binding protein n=1 Tax=Aliamphritea spongicola TaxID=707589 RepID=UPI00196ACE5A|nr:Fe(3+) ABC transporter substrate-binding protein [Aliamphritea spongicola]MBN3563389.1 Fe(3+) ABC transporter substrate-binding protein [Aliamphritea spongicola]